VTTDAAAKLKAASTNNARTALLEALKFAAVAVDSSDNSGLSAFVTIRDGLLMTENETFCIGVPVDSPLDMSLHAEKLQAALQQCGATFQMVQVSAEQLSITSGKFRAVIPILPSEQITPSNPDVWVADINDRIMEGFKACCKACTGKGERAINQSVLLGPGSIIGTNGGFAIEYWHGIDLPPGLCIPKKAVDTICKLTKPLAGFGFSEGRSVTFYFDDNSFIKTRLYAGEWPKVGKLFEENMGGDFVPLWDGFALALKAIQKFTENDTLHFHEGRLATGHLIEQSAASYDVPGLPGGQKFSEVYWHICLPYAERVKIGAPGAATVFISENTRGLIMGKH
jgi:hypothetical protein